MTEPSIPLASIERAFEGVIPASISTCAPDGTPNVSYLSVVRRVDDERVAITNQFFSKTTRNLRNDPRFLLRVVDPVTMEQYDLRGKYLHTEASGPMFDSMRVQLDAVAAQTGMTGTFRLRGIDVLRVDRCTRVGDAPPATAPAASNEQPLAALGILVRRLAGSGDLAEATRVVCESLEDLFGFGHSMVLLADETTERLFAVAAHGYAEGHVGAEIAFGEGLIGIAAQRRQMVRVTALARSRRMASAVEGADLQELPLRGLPDAQSLIAAPMLLQGRLVGVLYLDAAEVGAFDARAAEVVEVVAGHLAVTIALLEAGGSDPARREPAPRPSKATTLKAVLHDEDGSLFVDGDYIIRGIPGRILGRMLTEHIASGRTTFTNKELRLDRSIGLPIGNDNLEARLLVLRRRLEEKACGIAVERVGRGRIELVLGGPVELLAQS
ncbi:MAG TPA: GAF domain-containing protein [Mycobacteriales bacterium]|nr:GAF domain-containing protein [Mycobacteriales bacterium]